MRGARSNSPQRLDRKPRYCLEIARLLVAERRRSKRIRPSLWHWLTGYRDDPALSFTRSKGQLNAVHRPHDARTAMPTPPDAVMFSAILSLNGSGSSIGCGQLSFAGDVNARSLLSEYCSDALADPYGSLGLLLATFTDKNGRPAHDSDIQILGFSCKPLRRQRVEALIKSPRATVRGHLQRKTRIASCTP